MISKKEFSKDVLNIDADAEIASITASIGRMVRQTLRRRGAVVAVSGGIDSSVCAALCARALGKESVLALLLPERDSSPLSTQLGRTLAASLGIETAVEDISPVLEASGCYRRQTEAIQIVFPSYSSGWKNKITIPSILSGERLNLSRLTVQSPSGESFESRIPVRAYLQLVAATNFKQRIRTMMTYYHADRLNFAVCGTPNRLEYDQGFFVKSGDGSADFKPIAHLYKTQVYALAEALGIPEEIRLRKPTSDTFSLPQTQEEFYFALPYREMDLCLYAHNRGVAANEVAAVIGLTAEQVERVYKDIEAKRRTTLPLHLPPLTSSPIPEISKMIQNSVGDRSEE